jgi:hypothetical protein
MLSFVINRKSIPNWRILKFIITTGLFFYFQFAFSQECNKLPASFKSYEQALNLVKSSTFKISQSVNTSKSSWIRSATYYSCDSRKGFLIIKTDDREYIHQDVPIEIWNGFKNAPSFGNYYDSYIKRRYKVVLAS